MTDYGVMLLLVIFLPILAFMLGTLWNEVGQDLKRGEEND